MGRGAPAVEVAESALRQHAFVKVIAGIASADAMRARNFAYVYTLAGAHAIDLSCDVAVLRAARSGVEEALARLAAQGRPRVAPLLMVSVGLESDPHVAAPLIDRSVCATCPGCVIPELKDCVSTPLEERHAICPSCYYCVGACPVGAIELAPRSGLSPGALAAAREAGANAVELHVSAAEPAELAAALRTVGAVFGEETPVSFSLGSEVSSHDFVELQVQAIEEASEARPSRVVIIQSEGKPASGHPGAGGGEAAVLPSLALAERVLRRRRRAFVQVSGGADEHTGALIRAMGLEVHGVAFGSCARALVSAALAAPNLDGLDGDAPVLTAAVASARRLVDSVAGGAAAGL